MLIKKSIIQTALHFFKIEFAASVYVFPKLMAVSHHISDLVSQLHFRNPDHNCKLQSALVLSCVVSVFRIYTKLPVSSRLSHFTCHQLACCSHPGCLILSSTCAKMVLVTANMQNMSSKFIPFLNVSNARIILALKKNSFE